MPEEATSEKPDVNTDEGFNRALAAATGKELSSEQIETLQGSDRSVANGLEYPESTQQPRDEKGQFLPKEPAAPPAQIEVPAGAAPTEPPADDPFAELIARHNGDVKAALAAVAAERDNAQSLIGKQGNEVGELREKLARLEGRLDATPDPAQAPAPFIAFSQLEAAISEAENPEEAAPGVMAWVVEHGTDEQIDQTLRVWQQYDPAAAADFAARRAYYEEAERMEAARGAQPAAAPVQNEALQWAEQQRLGEEMKESLATALKDVSPEEKVALAPYLSKAWENAPGFVKQAMTAPENRAEVLGQLVVTARSQLVTDTIAAAKAAGEAPPQVQVVSGANQNPLPSEGGTQEERTPEQVSKALRDALLATDTTSVSSGLTYGPGSPQQ